MRSLRASRCWKSSPRGGRRTAGLPLAEYFVQLSGLRADTGGGAVSGVCTGQKNHHPARVQGGGLLRGVLSAFSGGNPALWAGVLGEQGEPLRPGPYFYLCRDVLCGHAVPYGVHHRHGDGVSEPQPHADLPADPFSGRGDHDSDRAAEACTSHGCASRCCRCCIIFIAARCGTSWTPSPGC